jgi:alginate O-acetyltransferase complex protein AlgI
VIFTTWVFCVFMTMVFVCYWWIVPTIWRRPFLLAASVAYFTYNYPPYTLLLGILTLVTFMLGNLILVLKLQEPGSKRSRTALIVGLALSLGTLGYFKYSRMFVASWNASVDRLEIGSHLPMPGFLVPLGISFFTFEFIHYLTDLYHGKVKRASLLDFALFAFFFPSLVSGPVKRFQMFQEQGEEIQGFRPTYLYDGLQRIILGVAKKLIVADTAGLFTTALANPQQNSRAMLWMAMYAYGVKIYYDFSGYTDIAIGCGQLLGYRLPENFNQPYRQSNLSKFWNNWHMSLSSWIRDYLFIPLGGSRVGPARVLFNLTLVMAICGLWHGANWNFLAWGLWHGFGLAALRIYHEKIGWRVPDTRPIRWLSTLITVQYVCFGWVLFAAPGLPEALIAFQRML